MNLHRSRKSECPLIATAISQFTIAVLPANGGKPENLAPRLRGFNRHSGHRSVIIDNGNGGD